MPSDDNMVKVQLIRPFTVIVQVHMSQISNLDIYFGSKAGNLLRSVAYVSRSPIRGSICTNITVEVLEDNPRL